MRQKLCRSAAHCCCSSTKFNETEEHNTNLIQYKYSKICSYPFIVLHGCSSSSRGAHSHTHCTNGARSAPPLIMMHKSNRTVMNGQTHTHSNGPSLHIKNDNNEPAEITVQGLFIWMEALKLIEWKIPSAEKRIEHNRLSFEQ